MAQISYRANLTNGFFPLLVSAQGQTVIIGRYDNVVTPQDNILAGEVASNKDRGFPQVSYMHNVMPTHTGFKSVGFIRKIEGLGVVTFSDAFVLRDPDENKFLYSPVSGKHYIWDAAVGDWKAASTTEISSSSIVTLAYLNGETYIFFEKIGLFKYNTTTKLLTSVALTGITATSLNGICASNGYLIAWDDFTVYRSQPTSPLNFTSDPSLGSGSSIPNDIKGRIVACLPISDGFIIYCTKNAVAANFQNNIQYPFQYKEIKGSGGISHPSQVTWNSNFGVHYAWTTAGLLQINKLTAVLVFPEVTDFLTAFQYETFNTVNNTLEVTNLTSPLKVRLVLIGDRYLVLSYGVVNYTDALIQDLAYKRMGKVKIDHVAAFEYAQPNVYTEVSWAGLQNITWQELGNTAWEDFQDGLQTVDSPNQTIAFLQQSGDVYVCALDNVTEGKEGVLLLGKYQFVRDNWLQLENVSIQNAVKADQDTFKVIDIPTTNGMDFRTAIPLKLNPRNAVNSTFLQYLAKGVQGKNHTLGILGNFNLSDLNLTFVIAGKS